MTRKKDNYNLWLKERQERRHKRNAKRRARIKAKKESLRTWKVGCLITFKTQDRCGRWIISICRMKKVPCGLNIHVCRICSMINNSCPCHDIRTNTRIKCMLKRQLNAYPHIIGKVDKHGKYHPRQVLI